MPVGALFPPSVKDDGRGDAADSDIIIVDSRLRQVKVPGRPLHLANWGLRSRH